MNIHSPCSAPLHCHRWTNGPFCDQRACVGNHSTATGPCNTKKHHTSGNGSNNWTRWIMYSVQYTINKEWASSSFFWPVLCVSQLSLAISKGCTFIKGSGVTRKVKVVCSLCFFSSFLFFLYSLDPSDRSWKTDNWIHTVRYKIACLKQEMDNRCTWHVKMDSRCIATLPPNGTADETWNRKPAALQGKKKRKEEKKQSKESTLKTACP